MSPQKRSETLNVGGTPYVSAVSSPMFAGVVRSIPPDYRLHHIRIVSSAELPPTAFHQKRPARPSPGADIALTLDHTTRRGSHLDVVALAIEITRGARTVHVMGGTVALRRGVAAALGAVFGGLGDECPVTWASPARGGPRTAPRPYASFRGSESLR